MSELIILLLLQLLLSLVRFNRAEPIKKLLRHQVFHNFNFMFGRLFILLVLKILFSNLRQFVSWRGWFRNIGHFLTYLLRYSLQLHDDSRLNFLFFILLNFLGLRL